MQREDLSLQNLFAKRKIQHMWESFFFSFEALGRISNQLHLFILLGQLAVQSLSFQVNSIWFSLTENDQTILLNAIYKINSVHV